MNLGGPEVLIILAVVLLLFGARKVPDLARSLGQAQREFKTGLKDSKDEPGPSDPVVHETHVVHETPAQSAPAPNGTSEPERKPTA